MKEESRHSYQKRIQHLEAEVRRLEPYRVACMNIFDGIMGLKDGEGINKNWVVKQLRSCFR